MELRKLFTSTTAISLLLTGGIVAAIMLSSMSFTGQFTATQGEAPEGVNYLLEFSIVNNSNISKVFDYDNTDGPANFAFDLNTSNITSSMAYCNYEENIDVKFWVVKGNTTYAMSESDVPVVPFESGINEFTIIAEPHKNRCPLVGSISLTAEQILE